MEKPLGWQGCVHRQNHDRLGEGSWHLAERGRGLTDIPLSPCEACKAHLRSEDRVLGEGPGYTCSRQTNSNRQNPQGDGISTNEA